MNLNKNILHKIILSLAITTAIVFLIAFITFNKTINNLIPNSLNKITDISSTTTQENYIFDLTEILPLVQTTTKKLNTVNKLANNSAVTKKLIGTEKFSQLQTTANLLIDLETTLIQLIDKPQKWIIIFQNSNELRATGGFMGSYAIVDINEGKVISINTEDIYDADGQFTGFVEAPKGVDTYLSSGNGLRLPDANWNPNLNDSAAQILQFFALGNKQNIAGIVFVNLDFAKELLKVTGPIELTDYNTIVTQNNIDEVLRSRRAEFFPGSLQKKHMLSQLLTKVRIKLLEESSEKIVELSNLFITAIQEKNLQFYSTNQTIEDIFVKHDMKQIVTIPEKSEYLYLVESNVGINKANKNIDRSVTLQKDGITRNIKVDFKNKNKKPTVSKLTQFISDITSDQPASNSAKLANDHLAYINYQRILVPESWQLQTIKYQNKEITEIDTETLTLKTGETLTQLGFLVTLSEEETGNLEINFTTSQDFDQIYIQKQPGIPNTNYILEYNQQAVVHSLNKNTLIEY